MDDFLDQIEDFLEAGSNANTMTYGSYSGVHVFGHEAKSLVLISKDNEQDIAIFDDKIADIPDDFISHVLETLQPVAIEIKKC